MTSGDPVTQEERASGWRRRAAEWPCYDVGTAGHFPSGDPHSHTLKAPRGPHAWGTLLQAGEWQAGLQTPFPGEAHFPCQ